MYVSTVTVTVIDITIHETDGSHISKRKIWSQEMKVDNDCREFREWVHTCKYIHGTGHTCKHGYRE